MSEIIVNQNVNDVDLVVNQNVSEVDITVNQNGVIVTVQPVITRNAEAFDGEIDGGTP